MTELEFAERLKKLRKANNMTQQELADKLGVSNKSVSRWETGGYPDVAMLGPLAKALGVTVDDLLGETPPIRSLGRADWQNLLSFAFAIGGGVLFFLFDLFAPAIVCYLLYLGAMAYGVYLQRHYTYHSRWFHAANLVMDFFVNLQLLAPLSVFGLTGLAEVMTSLLSSSGSGAVAWAFLPSLLFTLLPYLLCSAALTALTAFFIFRGQKKSSFLLRLNRSAFSVSRAVPVLIPVLSACFWLLYSLDKEGTYAIFAQWVYTGQDTIFYILLTVLTVLGAVWLLLRKQRWMLIPMGFISLGCTLFPSLAAHTLAYSLNTGALFLSNKILNTQTYPRFAQPTAALFLTAAVLAGLYILCCFATRKK